MDFDPKQTQALLAVADCGSFEAAALQLHLSASAVSQRVRALETRLGQPLLTRARPCRPTPAGKKLLQYLRRSAMLAEEFAAEFAGAAQTAWLVRIAVNYDSLETWLLPALAPVLQQEGLLLDIRADDQAYTHQLLESGEVVAAVSAKSETMRGCEVQSLGALRYRLLATPAFRQRYFAEGVHAAALRAAPLLVFNRKDALQAEFLQQHFHVQAARCPVHLIPSTHAFFQAVQLGLGYGMIPDLQGAQPLQAGEMVDLLPGRFIDVPLYWHHWHNQSPKQARLNQQLVAQARTYLLQAA